MNKIFSKTGILYLTASISGSATASCSNVQKAHPTVIDSSAVQKCSDTPPTIYHTVRIKIPDRLDQKSGRHVTVPNPNDNDNAPGTILDPNNPEPFDVDFTAVLKPGSNGDSYQVRVILEGSAFSFAEPTNDAGTTFHGISIHVDGKYAADFCTDSIIHHADGTNFVHDTVLMYVKHRDNATNPYPANLNIWISPKYAPGTPIMIDPKIKNNG